MGNLAQTAYEIIKRKIIDCDYRPGQSLNEASLASELGLTRMPLRDALRQLEFEGFVCIRPKKGVTIAKAEAEDIYQITEATIMAATHAISHYSHLIDRSFMADLHRRMSEIWFLDITAEDVDAEDFMRRIYDFCFELYDHLASITANREIQSFFRATLDKRRRFINMLEPICTANYFYNYFHTPNDTLDVALALAEGRFKDAIEYMDQTLRAESYCQLMVWITANNNQTDH